MLLERRDRVFKQIKNTITMCKVIIWSHRYKILNTEIDILQRKVENSGKELALYLYKHKDILNYIKKQKDYESDFNNLITFLNQDNGWKWIADDIK